MVCKCRTDEEAPPKTCQVDKGASELNVGRLTAPFLQLSIASSESSSLILSLRSHY